MPLMDSINDMMSSVLGDPESLKQIMELAELMKGESADGTAEPDTASQDSGGGFDPTVLINLMGAVSAAGGDDKNRTLLLALKPYLSTERQARTDKAVKFLKIYSVFTELKKSGMLNDLNKLI